MSPNESKKGKILVRSRIMFRVAGPAQSYSSVEFGYELEQLVDDDEVIIFDTARKLDELVDGLSDGRRDKAYRQLLKHVNAIEARSWRKETKR